MIEALFWVVMGMLVLAALAAAAVAGLWLWVLWPDLQDVWEDIRAWLNRRRLDK